MNHTGKNQPMTRSGFHLHFVAALLAVSVFPMGFPAEAQAVQEQGDAKRQPAAGMMRYPDVSKSEIAFSYGGDLWIVDRSGGVARPLASPPGRELFPRFNADGDKIAFVGNYEGDDDLYVIDIHGGNAERMTWHPQSEVLCDWTPDGSLLYSGNGFSGLQRVTQLFTISSQNPLPRQLPVPYGSNGAISADGKWLAYTPHSRDNRTWKRYRGGMASDIWLFNLETSESRQVTTWEGTDSLPMWNGGKVYYLSDECPQQKLNIREYDPATGNNRQVTDFAEFDCKWPSMGPGASGQGEIILQNGASLWLVDLATGIRKAVNITVPGDRQSIRPRLVDAADFIEAADVSPNAKRVAVEARGDIWSIPVKNGSPRNMTRSNGVAERMPAWSPDGRWIAYFSDESGEYELYLMESDGRGETRQLTKDGSAWRYNPAWSPDSKHIVFTDKAGNIFLHTIESGETKLVDTDPTSAQVDVSWAPDSGWLTYARASDSAVPNNEIWIYNIASAEKHQLTNYFSCDKPVFDRKGDYIFCSSNRAFDRPSYEDVGTSFIYSGTEVLLAIPLRPDVKQPLLPVSDEESWKDGDKKDDETEEKKDDEEKKPAEDAPSDGVSGTWSGRVLNDDMPADQRNFTLTLSVADDGAVSGTVNTHAGSLDITSGKYDAGSGEITLSASGGDISVVITGTIKDGKFSGHASVADAGLELTLEATRDKQGSEDDAKDDDGKESKKKAEIKPVVIDFEGIEARMWQVPVSQGNFGDIGVNDKGHLIYARRPARGANGGEGSIKIFDITDKDKEEKTVVDGGGSFSLAAEGKKLFIARGNSFYVVDAAAGQKLADKISTDGMKTMIDPKQEWPQVFADAWRIERDFFYDPNMHGVDWPAIRSRYAAMIEDCSSRADLGFLIGEMISELNVGHAYYRAAKEETDAPSEKVGLPGCRFEVNNGRYRVGEIFEGAAWDTDARSPLRAVGIKEGDYILEVNGIPLDASRNPYAAFVGLADKIVTLTVSDDTTVDDKDRQVPFKLLSSDNDLRFRAWIENNRRYIEKKSDGRVGYIYVVNTGVPGQNDLFRQFYGQASKEALIVDDRWNGGGQIPTRFVELLNRPVTNFWAKRDGRDWTWPPDSHQGPKCMLINGMAGSGGDMFPALFRQAGVGKLIGMRTWGGLVGISGNPSMIDGSSVTSPTFAFYEKDGTWGIEGHGVDPDLRVIDDPALMLDGGDPQMDVAIDLMLTEIKEHGFHPPKRPAYPDRSKMGLRDEDK
jgi:tricorn protease